jgi:iron complex transport system substrate-binding protein
MLKFIAAVSFAFLAFLSAAEAHEITDAAGRKVEIPDKISRVLAAGPPAAVLVYVLAPDKLTGWVQAPSDAEKPFLIPSVRGLPAYGRLTGKGGTANWNR